MKKTVKDNVISWHQGGPNFGENLSLPLWNRIIAQIGVNNEYNYMSAPVSFVGNIAFNWRGVEEDRVIIYGSGMRGWSFQVPTSIHAVRGELSEKWCRDHGYTGHIKSLGDAGILAGLYFDDIKPAEGEYDLIIHNMRDKTEYIKKSFPHSSNTIMMKHADPLEDNLALIKGARTIYTSAMHGLIVAESFLKEDIVFIAPEKENPWKFQDYYSATGRFLKKNLMANEAMTPTMLAEAQATLLKAFPYDEIFG